MNLEESWYSHLRAQWKPAHVKLLLIAESAPDDGGSLENRRFFYSDRLAADNLFASKNRASREQTFTGVGPR